MPAKKKVAKKKKITIEAAVRVIPPAEKRMPANAFKKGNEFRWQKGCESPNKSGRPKDGLRLVSKALRFQLSQHAPHAECLAAGLPVGASWAQVVGAVMIRQASRGDVAAAKLILEAVEFKGSIRTDLPTDADGNPLPLPSLNIVFTDEPLGAELLRQDLLGDGTNGALPPGD